MDGQHRWAPTYYMHISLANKIVVVVVVGN